MMMVMMLQCAVGSSSGTPGGDTCVTWCKQAYASSRGCGGGSGVEGGGGEGASWQQLQVVASGLEVLGLEADGRGS